MPSRAPNRNAVCLAVLLLAVAADQITKWWARSALADGRSIALVGRFLRLELVRNPGAAFSVGSGRTWMFTVLAVVILGAMAWLYRRSADTATRASIALLAGGAVGNLIDRLARAPGVFRGRVVDFIDYGGLFVGNIADIAIVGAAVAIVGLSLIGLEVDGSRAAEDAGDGTAAPDSAPLPTPGPAADSASAPDRTAGSAPDAPDQPERRA